MSSIHLHSLKLAHPNSNWEEELADPDSNWERELADPDSYREARGFGELAHLARAFAWHARGNRFDSGILHLKQVLNFRTCFLDFNVSFNNQVLN